MDYIFNRIFLKHDTGFHPENKERLLCFPNLQETKIESGEKYLELIHTKDYIERVKSAVGGKTILDPETPVSPRSFEAACIAVGASILASQKNDFALVRPPGHHAYPDHASGFCIFNNIAIATQKLVNEGKKVFILDIDGHCGDGTEYIFYGSDKVFYMSLHSYPAFPMKGNTDEIGVGFGKGFTVNIPLPSYSSDDVYLDAVNSMIPIIKQFFPDHVGLSVGFDAYRKDPLLNLNLSLNAYYKIGKLISDNFNNVFAVLEGGYNTEAIPRCAQNLLDGINRKKQSYKEAQTQSSKEIKSDIENKLSELQNLLSNYWRV